MGSVTVLHCALDITVSNRFNGVDVTEFCGVVPCDHYVATGRKTDVVTVCFNNHRTFVLIFQVVNRQTSSSRRNQNNRVSIDANVTPLGVSTDVSL